MGEDYYTRLSVGPEDKLIFSVSGENLRVALNELDLGLAFRSNELATEKCRIFTSDHRVVSLLEGRSLEAAAFQSPLKYAKTPDAIGEHCVTIDMSGAKQTDQLEIEPNEVIQLVSPIRERETNNENQIKEDNNFEIKTLSESSQTYEDDGGLQRASSGIVKPQEEEEATGLGERRKSL